MELRNLTKIVRNMSLYKNSINHSKLYLNNTEFEMIRYLSKKEQLSLVDLANYLNVDKALVTRMCKKLVKLGYIEIFNDENDKRKKILIATEKAKLIKQEYALEEENFYNACIKVLPKEEQEQFLNLLEKVYLESKKLRKTGFKTLNEKNWLF